MTIDRDEQTDALIIATAKGNVPLQVVRWSGARQAVTSSASSQVIPLPAGLEGMEISAVEDVYINFGIDDTVVASSVIANDGSRLFLAGVQVVPVPINPATGVPYTFMAVIQKSTNGIFQVESGSVNVSFPALPTPPAPPGDPDFANVVLLLDFAGSDGGTDITDLSNRGHVDTFVGNAQIDTALPFLGKNSLLLDGTGDQVNFPDSANWDFGVNDFTIEIGFRPADVSISQVIISNHNAASFTGFSIQHVGSTNLLNFQWGQTILASLSWTPVVDTFYHIAVTRTGTDLRVFIDGVQIGSTVTDSTNMVGAVRKLFLGVLRDDPDAQFVNGSIGAVRITTGVSRYAANFTPLTVFYPTSGPAAATDPDFASVVLLLDFAGADAGTNITDLSDSAHVETFVGNAQIDTDAQFLIENSLLGDGTGDRVTYADSADWNFGTGDFTIEVGVSVDIADINYGLVSTYEAGTGDWYIQLSSAGAGELVFAHGAGQFANETFVMTVDQWYHIAITREGTNLRLFVDGVQLGTTTTNSTDLTGGSTGLVLAGLSSGLPQSLDGNLGAVRITKGVARFTANFTPPTIFYPKS